MKWLFLSLCSLLMLVPVSAAASSIEQALAACRAEENALKRLECYDEIRLNKQSSLPAQASKGQQQATQSHASSAPKATAPTPAAVKAASAAADIAAAQAEVPNRQPEQASDNFGLEHKSRPEQTQALSMTVTKLSHNNKRELIIEFDNGQVWRQQGSGHYPIAVGEQHQIKRGILGSFRLGNERNNRTIQVRRER